VNLTLLIACITMLFLSLGQIVLKLFATDISHVELSISSLTQNISLIMKNVILLIVTYGIVFCLWVFVLQKMELSRAFPFAALTFVFVPLLSHFFLGETISMPTIWGACLIIVGIVVSTSL
jgi:drug/metabolite transporter (DMT)-like permease